MWFFKSHALLLLMAFATVASKHHHHHHHHHDHDDEKAPRSLLRVNKADGSGISNEKQQMLPYVALRHPERELGKGGKGGGKGGKGGGGKDAKTKTDKGGKGGGGKDAKTKTDKGGKGGGGKGGKGGGGKGGKGGKGGGGKGGKGGKKGGPGPNPKAPTPGKGGKKNKKPKAPTPGKGGKKNKKPEPRQPPTPGKKGKKPPTPGKKGKKGGKKGKGKPTPAVTGDPHFVMWSGHKFDFHGGCDLVLLQDPDFADGKGLFIHIRTKIVRWWSYVESAVVQIGDDTLEVVGGVEPQQYFLNGQPGEEKLDHGKVLSFTVGGYPLRYRRLSEKSFQVKIFLEEDQAIVLKSVKDFMRVDVENPTEEYFGKSTGLMGSFNGGGKMLARDGVTVLEDPDEFGKEWQVLETEPMLFHDVAGVQHPEICAMPSHTEEKRRLEGSISREQATKACSHVPKDERNECIFDVMATNDLDMAESY